VRGELLDKEQVTSLVQSVQQGDELAFTALVCALQDIAVAYAASILHDRRLAEDVAQEAFVEAYRELPNLRDPAAFNAWFRTIIFKHCDRLTRRKRHAVTDLEVALAVASPSPSPLDELEQRESNVALWQAIAALSEAERTVVLLYYMGEHSTTAIAEFLNITANAVKTRLYAARKRLRKRMGQIEDNLQDARPSKDPQFAERVQRRLAQYRQLAEDLLAAYNLGDPDALQRLNEAYSTSFTVDQLRDNVLKRTPTNLMNQAADLTLADAQRFIASLYGFDSWAKLAANIQQPPNDAQAAAFGLSSTPPFYKVDWKSNTLEPLPPLSEKDWDTIFGALKERGITGLNAGGLLTDDIVERLVKSDQVTRLNLGGTKRLTDAGLLRLARMPQLQELNLSDYPGGAITDAGLEVLRHLPELRRLQICWQSGVTDAGVANLRGCDQLESVDLMGTPTGDGAIKALAGKQRLRYFKTGRHVTDAGLPFLQQFPVFKQWQGGLEKYALLSPDAEPNHLLLDGPFTDQGLASLIGLDGLFGLSFFWHVTALTAASLRPLTHLPHLGFLGYGGELCNDDAMRHIAAIPCLRMLMGQGAVASDEGFTALSRSQSIEYIWGRECPNLSGRGFAALAAMPALKGLAVSCKNVDDAALSALPRFPALRELMPMDVPDDGYRHIGRCGELESLVLMYCRDTGDTATEHIAGLSKLKSYFASYTKITDRSMRILGRLLSLERITFYGCPDVTDAGVVALANLPRLRELQISGPQITRECAAAFPASVRVEISV
jgi:RNA polymerase sigma factor (sigma-70 family)